MRVLIGVDGSVGSMAAARFVGRLLSENDEVVLYYSLPHWLRTPDNAPDATAVLRNHVTAMVFGETRQCLSETLRCRVETITGVREPREGLLLAADESRADVIAIGARGTGPLHGPTVGSLARHVVHHSTLPVLVIRGDVAADERIRILLASEGSEVSQHAGAVLKRFTWPKDAIGQTITVIESPRAHVPKWLIERLDDEQVEALGLGPFEHAIEEARLREDASRWYGALPAIFEANAPIVQVGHAGEQILLAIDTHRINLVVVGARRQGAVRRLLLGSTSEHILTHAPCSVLIVPVHEPP